MIAEKGHAPSLEELAAAEGTVIEDVKSSLERLHKAHALLLHPHRCEPWAVHPFALSAGACWVETAERGYWANCLYCGLGIVAALGRDGRITTRFGGESRTAVFRVESGKLLDADGVFHLAVPVRHWWDNVIHACASFQPFASEAEVDPWCQRHALPRGHVMTLEALWQFALDWYGNYLELPWRKRTAADARELFGRHGLTSDFWSI